MEYEKVNEKIIGRAYRVYPVNPAEQLRKELILTEEQL